MKVSAMGSAILPALTALHVLTGVDGSPTQPSSLALADDSPPTGQCTAPDKYWDTVEGKCKVCVLCGPGTGSTARECGHGTGEKGRCVECVEGLTYQEEFSQGSCLHCTQCDEHASVISNCTATKNAECGPCKPGYGPHPGLNVCSLCSNFNEDEKPLECLSTPAPIIDTSPPTPTEDNFPSTPTQSPTTGDAEGTTPPPKIYTGTSSDVPVATSPNSTTPADPGGSSSLEVRLGLGIPLLVVGVVLIVVLAVYLYKRRCCQQKPEGPNNTNVEAGTAEERELLDERTRDNGEPKCTVRNRDTVRFSAGNTTPANGSSLRHLDETLSNGAPAAGNETPSDKIPAVQDARPIPCTDSPGDAGESLPPSVQPSSSGSDTAGNVNASQCAPDSAGGDTSPNGMPAIPEENNHDLSAASQPQCSRQLPLKLPRPPFKRSISEPADQSEGALQYSRTEPVVLSSKTRAACNKNEAEKKKEVFDRKYEKACSLGGGKQWKDLSISVRKTAGKMLTRDPKSYMNNYIDLGDQLGLNRNTDLKACSNAEEVFEVLETSQEVPPSLEVILQALKAIKRLDVVRVVMKGILNEECENSPT